MTGPSNRIDRRIGWIMSIGGAALLLGQAPIMLPAAGDYPAWWNAGVAVLAMAVLASAAIGMLLPQKLLVAYWRLMPILGAALMLAAFVGYDGPSQPEEPPWILAFDAVLSSYLVLWLRPWAAAAVTILMATFVPLSALIFLDSVPQVVLVSMPIHMSNIVYVAIFVGIRRQMIAMRTAEVAAEESRTRQLQATVASGHQEHVSRMLHDEVLSVLTAAFRTRGTPSTQLAADAGHALAMLEAPLSPSRHGSESCTAALQRLVEAVHSLDPVCSIDVSGDSGMLPMAVTDAIIGAACEAVRNSLRHAGPGASRTLLARAEGGRFEVNLLDDGDGFDSQQARIDSLGISRSIIGRMRELPGGSAGVSSHPGGGTNVELKWQI